MHNEDGQWANYGPGTTSSLLSFLTRPAELEENIFKARNKIAAFHLFFRILIVISIKS